MKVDIAHTTQKALFDPDRQSGIGKRFVHEPHRAGLKGTFVIS
jgi:hypothetical protein